VTDSTGIARPCPRGTYKSTTGSGVNGTCTRCAEGVTTPAEGSTSAADCSLVAAGLYAAAMTGPVVTATRRCPQRMWCPGGRPEAAFNAALAPAVALAANESTIQQCPDGTWTQAPGAASVEQCRELLLLCCGFADTA
jgi:hypothetical protein